MADRYGTVSVSVRYRYGISASVYHINHIYQYRLVPVSIMQHAACPLHRCLVRQNSTVDIPMSGAEHCQLGSRMCYTCTCLRAWIYEIIFGFLDVSDVTHLNLHFNVNCWSGMLC